MSAIDIHDVRNQLSKLVERAAAGRDVIITRHGKPVVRLTALQPAATPLRFGVLKGRAGRVAKDFDAPLPPEVQAPFQRR